MSSDWFGWCSRTRSPSRLLVWPMYNLLQNGLNGFLGSRYFLYVINERTSLSVERI